MFTTNANLMTGSANITYMDESLFASEDNPEMLNVEAPLRDAFIKSLEIGSVMPLVKEELKLKIQSKRLSEGMEELSVEFTSSPKYELTQKEKKKIEIRKKRNRQSASKSRQKRKSHEENIVKHCLYLATSYYIGQAIHREEQLQFINVDNTLEKLEEQQAMHDKLNIEVNALRNIKKLLQERIIKYLTQCPKCRSVLLQQSKMNQLHKETIDWLREMMKHSALPTSNLHNAFSMTTDQLQIAISAAT